MKQKKIFMSCARMPVMTGKRVSIDFTNLLVRHLPLEQANYLIGDHFEGWEMGVVSDQNSELYTLVVVQKDNWLKSYKNLCDYKLIEYGFYLSRKMYEKFIAKFKFPLFLRNEALCGYKYPRSFPVFSSDTENFMTVEKQMKNHEHLYWINNGYVWQNENNDCCIFVLCDKDGHLIHPSKISNLVFQDYYFPYTGESATGKYLRKACCIYPFGVDFRFPRDLTQYGISGIVGGVMKHKNTGEKAYLVLGNDIVYYYLKLAKGEFAKTRQDCDDKSGCKSCYYISYISGLDYLRFDMSDNFAKTAFVPSRELMDTVMKKQFSTIGEQFDRKYWIGLQNTPISLELRNNEGFRPCIFTENGCEVTDGEYAKPLVAFLCDEYGCFLKHKEVDNYEFYTA